MATPSSTPVETVIREFPPLGKYRVRLVQNPKTRANVLDIREYISSDGFEGFTRRGIRLSPEQLPALAEILAEMRDAEQNPARFNGRNFVHDADNVLQPSKPAPTKRAKPTNNDTQALPAVRPSKPAAPAMMAPQSFSLFDIIDATQQPAPEVDDSQETQIPPQFRHEPEPARPVAPVKKRSLSELAALL